MALDTDIRFRSLYRFDVKMFDPASGYATKEQRQEWETYLTMARAFAEEEGTLVSALSPDAILRAASGGRRPKYLILIYFRSRAVGYALWEKGRAPAPEKMFDAETDTTVVLTQVWINPEYRGRGIFKKLIDVFPDLISPTLYYPPNRLVRMAASFPSFAVNERAGAVLKRLGFERGLVDYLKKWPEKRGVRFKHIDLDGEPPVLLVSLYFGNKCAAAFRAMGQTFYGETKGKHPSLSWRDVTGDFKRDLCRLTLIFNEKTPVGYVLWQGWDVIQAFIEPKFRGRGFYKRFLCLLPEWCFLETGRMPDGIRARYAAIESDKNAAAMYERLGFEKVKTDAECFYELKFAR